MIASLSLFLLAATGSLAASPTIQERAVASLDAAAFAEAQPRDNTATRAFSAVPILTSTGQCLDVNELSGDFRANLNPIQVAPCNGSTGQLWDVITAGVHNNVANSMLVVNTLTQACMNFDPRRAAGDTVIMFSCGGRADGGGSVTNSQLFPFNGTAGPLALTPENAVGTCFTVTAANVIDEAPCNPADPNQSFTFLTASNADTASSAVAPVATPTTFATSVTPLTSTTDVTAVVTSAAAEVPSVTVLTTLLTLTLTLPPSSTA